MRSASDVAEHDKRSHPVRLLAPPHPKKIRHPQKLKFRRSTGTGGWRNSAHFVSVSHESYKTRVSRARSLAHIKVVRFPRLHTDSCWPADEVDPAHPLTAPSTSCAISYSQHDFGSRITYCHKSQSFNLHHSRLFLDQ